MTSLGITVKLVEYTKDAPKIIAAASKMSVSRKTSTDLLNISNEEVDLWIKETLKRGHLSPWEHSSYTFIVEGCSRVCSHQLVRHRIASYTQQSMRYTEASLRDIAVKAGRLIGLECPTKPKGGLAREAYQCYAKSLETAANSLSLDKVAELANQAYVIPPSILVNSSKLDMFARSLLYVTSRYYQALYLGTLKEDARFIIPMAVRTKVTFTMNGRELIQSFLPLRMCSHAQWEIRHVAWLTWQELIKVHPQLFKYAGPSCVLLNNSQLEEPMPLESYLNGTVSFIIPRCPELISRDKIPSCLLFASRSLRGSPLEMSSASPGEDETRGTGQA